MSFSIKIITWDIIGLDSNSPSTSPIDTFFVGVRVTNNTASPLSGLIATFVWDSVNNYINIDLSSIGYIYNLDTIAANSHRDCYFQINVSRNNLAFDTSRTYHITVTDGVNTVSTPTGGNKLYVKHLISQNRNSVTSIEAATSAVPSTPLTKPWNLIIGQEYIITVLSKTATGGYGQLVDSLFLPNKTFRIDKITTSYSADAGTDPLAYSRTYANGCGWDIINDACTSSGNYGGTITTVYNVTIIGHPISIQQKVTAIIYDFSGNSFHYNSDYSTFTVDYTVACFLSICKLLFWDQVKDKMEFKEIANVKQGDYIMGLSGNKRQVIHCGGTSIKHLSHYELIRKIPKDFFDLNVPCHDVYVTKWHSIFLPKHLSGKYSEQISKTDLLVEPYSKIQVYDKIVVNFIEGLNGLTVDEVKSLTCETEPKFYHVVLDDPNDGVIVENLGADQISQAWWDSCSFVDNV